MSCLADNLKYIKKKNKDLYDRLQCYNISETGGINEERSFNIIKARDGEKIVEISLEDNKSISLNSRYNPKREADKWASQYDNIRKITSVILYGYGEGIFFSKLKNRIEKSAYIFWYEPDFKLFWFCLTNFDMTQILSYDNVFLYVEGINSKNLFMDLCNNISWSMLSSQILCYHTGYKKLYHEKYTDFNLIIDKYKYALKISQNTSLKYAKKFSVNILKNIHFIKKSNYIGELIGKIPKNIPVIIISAGPSFEKNICELKKARNKALILATDTAVDYLQKKDIKFDAIVTIDGDKKLERIGDEACKYLPMFTIPDAKNEFLEENEGRKIWISGAGYLECLYEKFNIKFPEYIAGGSVATAAFQIAKMICSKTIILVGQDLAYSGKITHIGNVIDGYKSDGEDLFVEGILEDKVRTRYDWLRYLQWFESAIEQLGDDQFVIDATEGGAKIHGAVEMKLSQAIDRYCKVHFDFDDFLSELNVTFTGDKYLEICKDIANISNELEDILRYSKIGVEIIQDIIETLQIKKINDIEINRNLNEIDKLKEKITDKKIYILLDEYISEDVAVIFKKNKQIYNSEVEELLDNIKSNKILFEALINASNKLKKVAEKSVTKMYDID